MLPTSKAEEWRASIRKPSKFFVANAFAGHPEVLATTASPLSEYRRSMSAAALNQCSQPIGVLSVEASTPVAWSTDGNHLAAVGGNGSIFILELGKDLLFHMSKLLPGHKHGVKALLFHPTNANVLVSAGVDGIFVHDLALGAVTLVVSHKTHRELGLDTSASALLGTADGAHDGDVECMTWAYDGGCLITGGKDASVKVWDTAAAAPAAWRLLETVSGHKAPVLAVEFCPAVQRFASAGRDASIKLWDASTLALDHRAKRADDGGIVVTLLGTCESHGDVICLLWAPDGSHIVSGSRDNGVRIWSSSSFTEIREVSDKRLGQAGKHRSDVRRLAYLPPVSGTPTATEAAAGRRFLLSCSLDGSMRLWLLEPVVEVESTAATIFNAGDGPGTAERRGAGAGAGAGADPTAASSGLGSPDALLGLVEGAAGLGLGLGDAGSIGTGASGGWDDVTRKLLGEIMGSGGLSTAAVTGKGSQGGVDSCLATMSFFGGENASRGAAEDGVSAFALNPAQPIVAYASSAHAFALGKLRLDTLEWLLRQKAGTLPPNALPPGTSLDPVAQVQAFYGHTGAVNAVQLIGDDRTLVTASNDYTAAVYDIASVERRLLLPYGTSVHCLALGAPLSAGGAPLVYVGGADYAIRGYSSNPADYEPIRRAYASKAGGPEPVPAWEFQAVRYLGHSGRVESIAVDAKNRVMASAGRDWSVLLWDLTRPAPALSVSVCVPGRRQPVWGWRGPGWRLLGCAINAAQRCCGDADLCLGCEREMPH
jgi:WD40 repeat protein